MSTQVDTAAVVEERKDLARKITADVRAAFLDLVEGGRTVTDAAGLLGVKTNALYAARKRLPEFASEWDGALRCGGEVYINEMHRRAVDGTTEPIMFQGRVVETVQKYSDRLLELAIKGRFPEQFGDRTNINLQVTQLTTDDLLKARELGRDDELHGALEVLARSFAEVEAQRQLPAAAGS